MKSIEDFVHESNLIEGIRRIPTEAEIEEHKRFVELTSPTIADLEHFVSIYQPDAVLRDKPGLNVRVGNHYPPPGSPDIRGSLECILADASGDRDDPYTTHVRYETLHPFTDGNGRSGRVLWAWQMWNMRRGYPLGFLHHFYYQSLEGARLPSNDGFQRRSEAESAGNAG